MICKNCSGEYEDEILSCPYCGTENGKALQELKEDILEEYDKEADCIRESAEQYPEKTARKWTKYMVYVVLILLVLGIIVGAIAIVAGRFSVNVGYKKQQKHMRHLEELFQAEDYEAVEEYLDEKDLYESTYEKYREIARIYTYYSYMQEDVLHVEELLVSQIEEPERKEHIKLWCESLLKDSAYVLRLSGEYTEDMQFLENESVLENFRNETIERLSEFGYTEDEIAVITQIDKEYLPEELLNKLLDYFYRV